MCWTALPNPTARRATCAYGSRPIKSRIHAGSRSLQVREFWTTPVRTLAPTATRNQNEYIRENYALSHKGRWGWHLDPSLSQESAVREGELQTAKPKTKNTVLDGKLTMPLGNHMLLTGFQIRRNELKSDGYYSNPQGLGQGIDASFTEKSLFVEDEWAITEKIQPDRRPAPG